MKKVKFLLLSVLLIAISGCANNFADNYSNIVSSNGLEYLPPNRPVEVIITDNPDAVTEQYLKKGYLPIGKSEFKSNSSQSSKALRKHATEVGAQVAILSREDLGLTTVTVPTTTQTKTTTQATSDYNAKDKKSVTNVNDAIITTTYGSQIDYVTYEVNPGNYTALFLAQLKLKTGVIPSSMTEEWKRKLQRNSGVIVAEVVEDSPAYFSNVLKGDVILDVNGKEIFGVAGFNDVVNNSKSSKIYFNILRKDKILSKQLNIPN